MENPDVVINAFPDEPRITEMSDREILEELLLNARQVREIVLKVIGDVEASPLGAMLKPGGGKINLMSLLMGK